MTRSVQIPARDMLEEIYVQYLRPRLGAAAQFMDYHRLLEAVLDGYFYDTHPHLRVKPVDVLIEMGLPTDIAYEAIGRLEYKMLSAIQAGFILVWPGRTYTYRITADRDVFVTEEGGD